MLLDKFVQIVQILLNLAMLLVLQCLLQTLPLHLGLLLLLNELLYFVPSLAQTFTLRRVTWLTSVLLCTGLVVKGSVLLYLFWLNGGNVVLAEIHIRAWLLRVELNIFFSHINSGQVAALLLLGDWFNNARLYFSFDLIVNLLFKFFDFQDETLLSFAFSLFLFNLIRLFLLFLGLQYLLYFLLLSDVIEDTVSLVHATLWSVLLVLLSYLLLVDNRAFVIMEIINDFWGVNLPDFLVPLRQFHLLLSLPIII